MGRAQIAVQGGPRDGDAQPLIHHKQQLIQRRAQRIAQGIYQDLLLLSQYFVYQMRRGVVIGNLAAVAPAAHRSNRNPQFLRQFAVAFGRFLKIFARSWRGGCVGVQLNFHTILDRKYNQSYEIYIIVENTM